MELDDLQPPGPDIRTIRVIVYVIERAMPDIENRISEIMDTWMTEYGFRLYRRAMAYTYPTDTSCLIWELDREKFWNEPRGNDHFFKQIFYVPEHRGGFYAGVTFLYWYPGK